MARTGMTRSGWCAFGERHDVCHEDLVSKGAYSCSCSCHDSEGATVDD